METNYCLFRKQFNGIIYKTIIIEIIEKANTIELYVQGIVFDMDSSNQTMWRFDINVSKYSTVNKCMHLVDSNQYLFSLTFVTL